MIVEASIIGGLYVLLRSLRSKPKSTPSSPKTPTTPGKTDPKTPTTPKPTPDPTSPKPKPKPTTPKPTPDGPKPIVVPKGASKWGTPIGAYTVVGDFANDNYIMIGKDCTWVVEGPSFRQPDATLAAEAPTLAGTLELEGGNNTAWGYIDYLERHGYDAQATAMMIVEAVSPMCASVGPQFWGEGMREWFKDLVGSIKSWRVGFGGEYDQDDEYNQVDNGGDVSCEELYVKAGEAYEFHVLATSAAGSEFVGYVAHGSAQARVIGLVHDYDGARNQLITCLLGKGASAAFEIHELIRIGGKTYTFYIWTKNGHSHHGERNSEAQARDAAHEWLEKNV